MEPADARRVLDAWDAGVNVAAPHRARAILRQFAPHLDDERIGVMTIGERDRELLGVRRRLFGDRLAGSAACCGCQQRLEVELDAGALLRQPHCAVREPVTVSAADEIAIVARPACVADLECAAESPNVSAAQATILQRCIQLAQRAGEPIAIEDLPAAALHALGTQLAAADPDSQIELEVSCPECRETSRHTLDIAAFLWTEIEAEVLRLLHDVHRLARGYGWREQDILAMSRVRRRAYLGMLPQ